jgi:hypothetical protein
MTIPNDDRKPENAGPEDEAAPDTKKPEAGGRALEPHTSVPQDDPNTSVPQDNR